MAKSDFNEFDYPLSLLVHRRRHSSECCRIAGKLPEYLLLRYPPQFRALTRDALCVPRHQRSTVDVRIRAICFRNNSVAWHPCGEVSPPGINQHGRPYAEPAPHRNRSFQFRYRCGEPMQHRGPAALLDMKGIQDLPRCLPGMNADDSPANYRARPQRGSEHVQLRFPISSVLWRAVEAHFPYVRTRPNLL